jgi:hypothetical protein
LLDLNEETARITALYRTNQQREQLLAQRDANGRLDRNVHRDRDATGFRRERDCPEDGVTGLADTPS